jgi:glycosyltransferase involved in cell wall biosynthesis/predicted nucleic acid-binding protein
MNLLYVAPDIPVPHTGDFVGGSTHVLKVAESLAKRGNSIFIISRRVSREQKRYEEIHKNILTRRVYRGLVFPIRGKPSSKEKGKSDFLRNSLEGSYFFVYRFILIFLVLYLLKKHKIDLILDRSSSRGVGVFPGFFFGIPTVVELLDPDYSELSLKLANKIFAYTKRIVNPSLHEKVEIVNAGVDTTLFKPAYEEVEEIRRSYHLQDKKTVVYVGSLSAWHGAEDLIDVAAKLNEDIRFLMIGENLEMLGEKATERGVSSKFIYTGFVEHEEVPKYVSAADVAVAPYNPRGFRDMERYGFYFSPIKIFEYMACGKPVVASDLEIIRDIIKENQCGLVAKPGDAEDFAEKIRMLLGDAGLRKQFGENGRKAVIEKYTWDKVAEKICDNVGSAQQSSEIDNNTVEIVSDSSTLILLARSGAIEKMECVFLIPSSVYEESIMRAKEKGFEDAYLLEKFVEEKRIKVLEVKGEMGRKIQNFFNLHSGERDAIALTIELGKKYIFCDDKKAINACKILRLKFISALDILLAMYRREKISKEDTKKYLDKLEEFGWYDYKLIERVRGEIDGSR